MYASLSTIYLFTMKAKTHAYTPHIHDSVSDSPIRILSPGTGTLVERMNEYSRKQH